MRVSNQLHKDAKKNITGVLTLSRWKEYVYFVIPLTFLGSLLAVRTQGANLDLRIFAVLIGNLLVVAYAFMLNDIEDSIDDARDPQKRKRNPISSNRLSKTAAYRACFLVAAATLFFYFLAGFWVTWIGMATLILSHFYSWKRVRLKAWPVVDIVSHSLMLSGLLILAGYYAYETAPGIVWYVISGATMFSVYGQLYNQLRDFKVDIKAKLHNTAILLGAQRAQNLMYLSLTIAAFCFIMAAIKGAFPFWILLILLISSMATRKIRTKSDFNGVAVVDITGSMQLQATIVMNAVVTTWLLVTIFNQYL